MTRGVSLAACKAALNRQKYLFWQTDRPSPSKTCMQLSQSVLHLFSLDFLFLILTLLSTPNTDLVILLPVVLIFHSYIYETAPNMVYLKAGESLDWVSVSWPRHLNIQAILQLINIFAAFICLFISYFPFRRVCSQFLRLFSLFVLRNSRSQLGGSESGITHSLVSDFGRSTATRNSCYKTARSKTCPQTVFACASVCINLHCVNRLSGDSDIHVLQHAIMTNLLMLW